VFVLRDSSWFAVGDRDHFVTQRKFAGDGPWARRRGFHPALTPGSQFAAARDGRTATRRRK